jgi:hypothetical protein
MLTQIQFHDLLTDLIAGWEVEVRGALGWYTFRINPHAGFFECKINLVRWAACPLGNADCVEWRRVDMGKVG